MADIEGHGSPTDYLAYFVQQTKKRRGLTDGDLCELHRQVVACIDPCELFVKDFVYLNAASLDLIETMPEDELRSRLALARMGE